MVAAHLDKPTNAKVGAVPTNGLDLSICLFQQAPICRAIKARNSGATPPPPPCTSVTGPAQLLVQRSNHSPALHLVARRGQTSRRHIQHSAHMNLLQRRTGNTRSHLIIQLNIQTMTARNSGTQLQNILVASTSLTGLRATAQRIEIQSTHRSYQSRSAATLTACTSGHQRSNSE